MYGYLIIKELEKRSKGYFRFNEGTLYPALHRLEREGFMEGRWERSPNGQERRYYYITPKGLQSLAEKREEWQGFATAVHLVIEPGNPERKERK